MSAPVQVQPLTPREIEVRPVRGVPLELMSTTSDPTPVELVVRGPDATYVHSQGPAQATWAVAHNLGKHPSVTVVDGLGRKVEADVTYLDLNLVEVAFAVPASGYAYLN